MDGSQDGLGERSEREKEAWAATAATVQACDPAAIFGPSSASLPPSALEALARATVFAAASTSQPDDGSDTAEVPRFRSFCCDSIINRNEVKTMQCVRMHTSIQLCMQVNGVLRLLFEAYHVHSSI